MSLANASTAATADLDGYTAVDSNSVAFNDATATGVIGWTDTETTGQAFGAFLNLDSETFSFRQGDPATDGFPSSTADAAGSLDLNFVYRPLCPGYRILLRGQRERFDGFRDGNHAGFGNRLCSRHQGRRRFKRRPDRSSHRCDGLDCRQCPIERRERRCSARRRSRRPCSEPGRFGRRQTRSIPIRPWL